jgi:hypothetical protein
MGSFKGQNAPIPTMKLQYPISKKENIMTGKCDVCGKETEINVCASTMGPISLGYCKDCLVAGLEPYDIMVAYISCAGKFPEDINEQYQKHVRNILKGLNVSEEQFIEDVNKSIEEFDKMYDEMSKSEIPI